MNVNRYKALSDISLRYPGLEGNELQMIVFQDWVISPVDVTLRLFDDNNEQVLSRHPVNKRDHQAVREQYVQNVLNEGVITGVRGQPWAIPTGKTSSGGVAHYSLISFATLTESIYEANRREPNNKYVR